MIPNAPPLKALVTRSAKSGGVQVAVLLFEDQQEGFVFWRWMKGARGWKRTYTFNCSHVPEITALLDELIGSHTGTEASEPATPQTWECTPMEEPQTTPLLTRIQSGAIVISVRAMNGPRRHWFSLRRQLQGQRETANWFYLEHVEDVETALRQLQEWFANQLPEIEA